MDNLTLSSGGERVATLSEDLHQVVGELTSSKIKTDNSMWKGITFIDGDTVGDTISRVHDDTSGTARGIKGEDSLDGNIHGGHVEGLEHDLGHILTVSLGVEGSLSEEDGLFLGGNTELIVEGVVPDLLHVIAVGDDSVLNGVLEGEDTSLGLGLISNIGILLSHTNHHTLVARTANNGGEDSSGSIISSKASLAHAGAIVNNKSSNVLVTHLRSFSIGASSPANPALHMPEPLSTTRAATSSSHLLDPLVLEHTSELTVSLSPSPLYKVTSPCIL